MTLGEKIKHIRTQAGLSQEQLAERLCVSRSAVAKWEVDGGIPDIENMKALAELLGVSVDYLLDGNSAKPIVATVREPLDLMKCGDGSKRRRKDRAVLSRFPDATIRSLQRSKVLSRSERVIDNMLGFLTDAPFGIPGLIHDANHLSEELYLVDDSGKQFVVEVSDEWIEVRRMAEPVASREFELDGWKYRVSSYEVRLE